MKYFRTRDVRYFLKASLFAISISAVLTSCDNQPKLYYGADSEILVNLVNLSDLYTINLDEVPIKRLVLSEKSIILQNPSTDANFLFSYPAETYAKDGKVYITDLKQAKIFIADTSNKIVDTIGRQGRGPGEYQEVSAIAANDTHIFIADNSLSRINLYDYNTFTFQKAVNIYVGRDDIAASNSYLFTATRSSAKNLIQAYINKEPYEAYVSFLPKLIPNGKEPSAYNNFEIDANANKIIAAYPGLPYLFVYDNKLNLQRTIQFVSESFNEFQNPPTIPKRAGNSDPFDNPVRRYIYDFELSDNGFLYVVINNKLTIMEPVDNEYEVAGRYEVFDGTTDEEKVVTKSFISQDSGTVYLNSRSYPAVYRLKISK